MAVAYSNQKESHRGIYFEAVGDGVTTALTVNHSRSIHAGATAAASVVTGPSGAIKDSPSGKGGFVYPTNGTAVTVSSVSVSTSSVTVNTQSAVGNGTRAYVAVVFNQDSPQH